MIASRLDFVGSKVADLLEEAGTFTRFCGWVWHWLFRGVNRWCRRNLIIPQLYQIGTKSIPVMMLVGAFVGMVLAVEGFDQFKALGQESKLGGIIDDSVVKQIGPVLAAVMLAGRIGGSVSAEIGTMRVTEQLDALRVMGADPVAYLVLPRVFACVVMIPILTVFSDLLGIWGGYLITVQVFGVNSHAYWDFSRRFVGGFDISSGLIKSIVFGLMIGLISCYKGFNCKPGAAGAGRAATESFVVSFVAIIVANFVLAKFLKDLYPIIYGAGNFTGLAS